MKKRIAAIGTLVLALLALMLLGMVPGLSVQAATQDATGDIGFYVRAVLPENQLDSNLTYFDLRVDPGQTQTLEVEVVNEAAEPITVDMGAISASTNRNGVIDYKTPDVRDATLTHPFSELATLSEDSLTIPAQSSATARITISMPEEEYDGVVLGGLVFTRQPGGQAESTEGMSLQNVHSYVIGVKLTENDTAVSPDFELESIAGETVNYQAAMVHSIRNKTASIAKNATLRVQVYGSNGALVAEMERSGVDMAPNSVMPLAVTPGSGLESEDGSSQATGQLEPGDYTSQITLEQDGQSWSFEEAFTIGSVQADAVNSETVSSAPKGFPLSTLLIILLGTAFVVIVVLFIILMRLLRRRQETLELNHLARQRREQLRAQEKYNRDNPQII